MRTAPAAGATLVAILILGAVAVGRAQDGGSPRLPAGEGRAETVRICTRCHGSDLLAMQHLDRLFWGFMIDDPRHRTLDLDAPTREAILSYLSATFPGPR